MLEHFYDKITEKAEELRVAYPEDSWMLLIERGQSQLDDYDWTEETVIETVAFLLLGLYKKQLSTEAEERALYERLKKKYDS